VVVVASLVAAPLVAAPLVAAPLEVALVALVDFFDLDRLVCSLGLAGLLLEQQKWWQMGLPELLLLWAS